MIAFTFPGQGSQKPGMGEPWVGHPSWEVVTEASDAVGRDLDHLLRRADADELRATRNAQLATFVTSLVVMDAVVRLGVEPAAMAGHSLGEYTALMASGAVSVADGATLVAERGEAMGEAATDPVGTMSAVLGLDDSAVKEVCEQVDGDVWVANYNAPGQVVIAGAPAAIEAAGVLAKEAGAKKLMALEVSGAFHTPFMAPAAERLAAAIAGADLRAPELPVYANVDAKAHTSPDEWADLLARQLTSPVRWRQILYNMADDGFDTFVSLGPGAVLSGLAKRTVTGAKNLTVSTPDDLDTLLEVLAAPPTDALGGGEGEHLFATERVVVSPSAGVFTPEALAEGAPLVPGTVIGHVGSTEVRSPFAGTLMGVLAMEGERVTISQPIAWLRTA